MSDFSIKEKMRYRFDNFMARGGSSIFTSLLVVFISLLLFIFLLRLALYAIFPDAASQHPDDFFTNLFITFLQMTDPGNMAQDISSSGWYKISSVLSGVAGIVMLSALIAFITTALDQKLSKLRKGHSKVIEDGHTLILGWSDRRIVEILRELVEANESESNPSVVILSSKDKEFMDDYLSVYMPNTANTRVVTRSGQESSLVDLSIVSVDRCKSCIVVSDCSDTATLEEKKLSDAKVIKTILAVHSVLDGLSDFNLVTEIFDGRYQRVAEKISDGNVIVLQAREILSKILVQTSRSVGLSVVYNEVLSFEGCEMYFYGANWGELKFGQAAFHFEDGVPMGIRHGDGSLSINPDPELKLQQDDELLILGDDNDTIEFLPSAIIEPKFTKISNRRYKQRIERELIIGWSPKITTILQEYSDYVLEGSTIDILPRKISQAMRSNVEKLQKHISNIDLNLIEINASNEKELKTLDLHNYDNIILLSPNVAEGEEERADAETILQLLLIRNVLRQTEQDGQDIKIITEILDSNNMELVSKAGVHDFIISNRFISMLMAQISESKDIKKVYDDLFSEDGSEIYLKPASLYFDDFPRTMTFADLIYSAQQRNEVCIGVKVKAEEEQMDRNFGVKLNPNKRMEFTLRPEDSLIVCSEDET